jgi:hypothetical protein
VPLDLQLPTVEEAGIVIDAQRDAAYEDALVVEDWVVYHPAPDGVPHTAARAELLADSKGLYLFWTVTDPEPDQVRARLNRRDNVWGDDLVGIYLDPAGDGQRAYLFFANGLGVQADAVRVANQDDSFSWDGQWDSAGRVTDTGFVVETFIPWDTVRHPEQMDTVGISLLRSTGRSGERSGWPRRDPEVNGIINQQNLLVGPGEVGKNRGLMLIPSLTAGYPTDQQQRWALGPAAPGLTVRYDPGPSLSLLATVNPDFSQVEGDNQQIDINQRYPLFFQERRPFFQEGQEWLDYGGPGMLYTRSMVTPRYGVRTTTEAGNWKLAALHVLDATPAPSVNEGGGWTEDDVADEMAFVTILRARRSVGANSAIGAFYSDKTLTGGELVNRVAGVDGALRLSDTTMLFFDVYGSHTVLSDGTTHTTPAGGFFAQQEGLNHELAAWLGVLPKGNFIENGFITRTDLVATGASASWKAYPSGPWLASITFMPVDMNADFRHSTGRLRDLSFGPEVEFRFADNTSVDLGAGHHEEVIDGAWLSYEDLFVSLNGNPTRWLGGGLMLTAGEKPFYEDLHIGQYSAATGNINLRPGSRLLLGASGSWETFVSEQTTYSGWVSRARVEAYANRELWMRVLWDRNSFAEFDAVTALGAWQVSPGRAVYLGTSVSQQGGDPMEWQAFAKASWVFML